MSKIIRVLRFDGLSETIQVDGDLKTRQTERGMTLECESGIEHYFGVYGEYLGWGYGPADEYPVDPDFAQKFEKAYSQGRAIARPPQPNYEAKWRRCMTCHHVGEASTFEAKGDQERLICPECEGEIIYYVTLEQNMGSYFNTKCENCGYLAPLYDFLYIYSMGRIAQRCPNCGPSDEYFEEVMAVPNSDKN